MAKIFFLPLIMAVFLSTTQALDLTGDWSAGKGENIYIRQVNNTIWCYSESTVKNENWTSIAYGNLEGNTVSLNWADVPKGNETLMGTLTLNVTSDNELQVIDQTGGWGGKEWRQIKIMRINSGF
ncbi:MAG: hypothetical protein EHM14_04820 [Methanothrix sp.]|nr:MAG: hypothetical protein EHM14_04820 [Methanothrix sp.]